MKIPYKGSIDTNNKFLHSCFEVGKGVITGIAVISVAPIVAGIAIITIVAMAAIACFSKSWEKHASQTYAPERQVAVLWYPKQKNSLFYSHTEILLGDKTFYNFCEAEGEGSIQLRNEKAMAEQSRFGFFRFNIRVTEEEFQALLANKDNDLERCCTCVGGVSNLLNKRTGLYIPRPFSQLPLLNFIYWIAMRCLRHPRVSSIEFVGPGETSFEKGRAMVQNLCSPAIPFELFGTPLGFVL